MGGTPSLRVMMFPALGLAPTDPLLGLSSVIVLSEAGDGGDPVRPVAERGDNFAARMSCRAVNVTASRSSGTIPALGEPELESDGRRSIPADELWILLSGDRERCDVSSKLALSRCRAGRSVVSGEL